MTPSNTYLQGNGQADEVCDHLFVGQLNGHQSKSRVEQLKVLVDIVFLFAAQVNMPVQLLAVLPRQGKDQTM